MGAQEIPAEHVGTVRDALMASLSKASRKADRRAWRAYRQALHVVGYVGARAVSIDVDAHGLLTALRARVSVEQDAMESASSERKRQDAYGRMLAAETIVDTLGLDELVEIPSRMDGRLRALTAGRRRR